jgi:hypothetical protein
MSGLMGGYAPTVADTVEGEHDGSGGALARRGGGEGRGLAATTEQGDALATATGENGKCCHGGNMFTAIEICGAMGKGIATTRFASTVT